MSWEDLENATLNNKKSRFERVATRSIQRWAEGKSEPKYEKVKTALMGLDLTEEAAFEVWSDICSAHGLEVKLSATRKGKSNRVSGFSPEELRKAVTKVPRSGIYQPFSPPVSRCLLRPHSSI